MLFEIGCIFFGIRSLGYAIYYGADALRAVWKRGQNIVNFFGQENVE